ncbi:MAG: DNA polymerase III subunit gamma/tau [Cyanobacteria bacterium REEB65]|nr:DNA polymerase III subunit gamma/tau [Cyanobacteria bacterium REEB65]
MSSYEALYRKYRPQTFRDLAGQDPVANTIRNEIRDGRVSHAYLFTGPRGTGKTTMARLLAKALNCDRGPTVQPCETPSDSRGNAEDAVATEECPQCRAIRLGSHLDVVEIDAASNRGIDDIRELQERVRLAPVQSRYKVFIVDEVHMLTEPAWNALLKTLEEPPGNCVFVLATTEVHKVLPTVVSRCQRFDFQRIGLSALVSRLQQVATAEGLDVDDQALATLARRAEGGLRDALSLLDQVAAGLPAAPTGQRTIREKDVFEVLGILSTDAVLELGEAISRRDAANALLATSRILAAGHDHRALLREITAWVRNMLLLQLAPDQAHALDVPVSQRDRLDQQALAFSRPELLYALEVLRETDQVLRGSPQATIWLEIGLLRLCDRLEVPSLVDLADRVAALEARVRDSDRNRAQSGSGTAPAPARVAAPVAALPPVSAPVPEPSGEGGAFEAAQRADRMAANSGSAPAEDTFSALKAATRGLRVSLRSNFDQFLLGASARPGVVILHMRQDKLFKEGTEGYRALLPLVRQRFGDDCRLEITTAPPPAGPSSPPAPPHPSVEPPAADLLASTTMPQVSLEPVPPDRQLPQRGEEDPVALASELLLGKVVEG